MSLNVTTGLLPVKLWVQHMFRDHSWSKTRIWKELKAQWSVEGWLRAYVFEWCDETKAEE